jgi:alkanesulfonate monooxygenase SsuD/methylene tetrahydromethanopterin reductase-like flavin-dependent oxidoreductase (luciferase family)
MRLSIVLSDAHAAGVDPRSALERDRALVAAARGRLDGITLIQGWATPRWNLQALTAAAYLSAQARPLGATVRGLPLGVLNPIWLAEQLVTVDHAWEGSFRAGLSIGSQAAFATHGVDPERGPARFEEGVGLIRRMWTESTLASAGPTFVIAEVRPTLRPVHPGGPQLFLDVTDEASAALAARLGLGMHAGQDEGDHPSALISAYRGSGGAGEVSLELGFESATLDRLASLAADSVDQVDVRLPQVDGPEDTRRQAVDDLARRLDVVRGR